MLSVLIAEDDPAMRHVLIKIISQIPDVKILGEAADGITALNMVEKLNPRVVFIDIDLPGINGVELAREICDINPQTILIFATAFDDYTHQAFEVYAFDYLVKPFKLDRIKKTIERIKQQELQKHPVATHYFNSPAAEANSAKLVVRQKEKMIFLDTQDIIFVTRENRKTVIITNKEKLSVTESLNSIEARLTANTFFRSHRAYIVNLNMIREISPWGKNGYLIIFSVTQQTAILAANKAKELEKILALPGR